MNVAVTANGSGENSLPLGATTITSATLTTANPNGVVHIDATSATAGETSTVNVTAFDPTTNTSTSRSFVVTVGPTNASPGPDEKPFLDQFPPVNTPIATAVNTPTTFQVQGISPGSPSDPLTYTVAGSTTSTSSGTTFVAIPANEGTATVSASGTVTVTPATGFTGNVTVLVGVRDQTDRTGKGLSDTSNYDVKQFTVIVGGPVHTTPVAKPVSATTTPGVATPIQLLGTSTSTGATLTYTITSQPANGMLTNFNPATGAVTYTSTGTFMGTDTFTYTTTDTSVTPNLTSPGHDRDQGLKARSRASTPRPARSSTRRPPTTSAPDSFTYTTTDVGITPNLTSAPGTVSITVSSGVTGAVRLITERRRRLRPRHHPAAEQEAAARPGGRQRDGVRQHPGRGQRRARRDPTGASSLTEIVIYGSKTGTTTVVAPTSPFPSRSTRATAARTSSTTRLGQRRDQLLVRPQCGSGRIGHEHDRRPQEPPGQGCQEPRH